MKKSVSLFALAMALTTSVASASVPQEQMNIGGVAYGATKAQTEAVCGQPIKMEVKQKYYGQKTECKYANGLEVTFINGTAQEIELSHWSDVATAGGVKIGMAASTLQNVYGQPDVIYKDKYIYYLNGTQDAGLVFEIEHGIIDEIECGNLR